MEESQTTVEIRPIAHIRSDFASKFGIPRQSGLAPALKAEVVFEPDFAIREAVRGLSDFSHIWLIWGFSENQRDSWSPTVRPPRLGGNTRMGVFATRSPFRPNGLGLSSVRLSSVEYTSHGVPILHITGADLMDGTPVYDIKPYLITTDCHPDANTGFVHPDEFVPLQVEIPDTLSQMMTDNERESLLQILSQDPRPAYQDQPERIYGFPFSRYEIKFFVKEDVLHVTEILPFQKTKKQ